MKDGISLYFSPISSLKARVQVRVPAPRPPCRKRCRCQLNSNQIKLVKKAPAACTYRT